VTSATVIDGKAVAAELRRRIAAAAAGLRARHDVVAGLATILVGDDPASRVYVDGKHRACAETGLVSFARRLPGDLSEAALLGEIAALGTDERVDGILVQLPLPSHIDVHRVTMAIDPAKDVDGFHPLNVGRLWSGAPALVPCTPQGCLRLLHTVHAELASAEAVVLGRSNIVGKPMAALLLAANCTVTVLHSRSREIAAACRRADILVSALGRPHFVKGEWIKPGATIIDVGISRTEGPDGRTRLVGDVEFAAAGRVAGAITPVPGGVGPMTIACLLANTVIAACRRRALPDPDFARAPSG
jgi:methylenetetrahydrofolate dehydrogenase (NADP+)/methenyltetrahydrofolate cyclohydrolase